VTTQVGLRTRILLVALAVAVAPAGLFGCGSISASDTTDAGAGGTSSAGAAGHTGGTGPAGSGGVPVTGAGGVVSTGTAGHVSGSAGKGGMTGAAGASTGGVGGRAGGGGVTAPGGRGGGVAGIGGSGLLGLGGLNLVGTAGSGLLGLGGITLLGNAGRGAAGGLGVAGSNGCLCQTGEVCVNNQCVCGGKGCVSCCEKQTPDGPKAFQTTMYECACADPCYATCKTFCDANTSPTPACLACMHDNLDKTDFCRKDRERCQANATCKAYVDCTLNSCADRNASGSD
jgi:hypothetical protein